MSTKTTTAVIAVAGVLALGAIGGTAYALNQPEPTGTSQTADSAPSASEPSASPAPSDNAEVPTVGGVVPDAEIVHPIPPAEPVGVCYVAHDGAWVEVECPGDAERIAAGLEPLVLEESAYYWAGDWMGIPAEWVIPEH